MKNITFGSEYNLDDLLFLLSFVGIIAGVIWGVISKVKKKPIKTPMIVLGCSIILLFIAAAVTPNNDGSVQTSTGNITTAETTILETTTQETTVATAEATTTQATTTTVATTKSAASIKEDYMAKCKKYSFKDIARNPEQYKGEYAKLEGQVIQVMEENGFYSLRVNITKGEYDIWSDTIMVAYQGSSTSNRILEDDIITMYGKLDGMYTYTSTMGASITVPLLRAEYVDIK